MSSLSQWGAAAALCLLCIQEAHGQPQECGGDYVCIADDPAAAIAWAEKRGPQLRVQLPFDPAASMNLHRCVDTPGGFTAASEGERRLVCSTLSAQSNGKRR